MTQDPRLDAARAILEAAGIATADVQAAGHDGAIAIVTSLTPASVPQLAALAPRIKALGFRYLTIDISESQ
jgi:hypothetical protein